MNRPEFVKTASLSLIVLPILNCATAETATNMPMEMDAQPFAFQIRRLLEALDFVGAPISADDKKTIETAIGKADAATNKAIIDVLSKYVLFEVEINPESRVKVAQGQDKPELWENVWRTFLVKINNQAGVTAQLAASSPQAKPVFGVRGDGFNGFPKGDPADVTKQDIGFRNETDVLFNCLPSTPLVFRVTDENGKPTVGSFLIKDALSHVYPSQAKRLAPDFYFQPQIYRADNEQINLPAENTRSNTVAVPNICGKPNKSKS